MIQPWARKRAKSPPDRRSLASAAFDEEEPLAVMITTLGYRSAAIAGPPISVANSTACQNNRQFKVAPPCVNGELEKQTARRLRIGWRRFDLASNGANVSGLSSAEEYWPGPSNLPKFCAIGRYQSRERTLPS